MSQIVSHLTQSRYYSPAFNAAVFDGPIRIYFAQHQESLALKVYFRLQNRLKEAFAGARNAFRQSGQTVFLMLYPTVEAFETSFSKQNREMVVREDLGDDIVLGVRGPLEDEDYEEVFRKVEEIFASFHPVEAMAEL
jgi:hypothetical protein